ncbi:MAG: LamG domain-containing protein, partial [Planctomycetes bacterium]|nr:LamG domain-containing protein [Planctomycetota bacterium]
MRTDSGRFDRARRRILPPRWTAIVATALMLISALSTHGAEGDKKIGIADKTLVAWVLPANLTQRGGSVLTMEKSGGIFDAIVLGEISASKWMAGSNGFGRTQKDQAASPTETADSRTLVQIAIVYRGTQITIYRNGVKYADYAAPGSEQFGGDSLVLMGLRHLDAQPQGRFFTGAIDDARIYGQALTAEQICSLMPNQPSDPPPLAWWDFEDGSVTDRMKRYAASTLLGDARIADGRLCLDQDGAYLLASREAPIASIALSHVDSANRCFRERLLGDPFRPGYH